MKKQNDYEKKVADCIEEMKEPIVALSKKHGVDVINGAMLELSLRMFLMRTGSTQVLHMFASTVSNLIEKGPLIEVYMEDADLDEVDWLKNGNLVKPTIH
mgnify:CR=1 FL=1|jgi:hypothetical protein